MLLAPVMDAEKDLDEDSKGLPTRLFDRLDQIPGYSWLRSVPPSRSVSGLRCLILSLFRCKTSWLEADMTTISEL